MCGRSDAIAAIPQDAHRPAFEQAFTGTSPHQRQALDILARCLACTDAVPTSCPEAESPLPCGDDGSVTAALQQQDSTSTSRSFSVCSPSPSPVLLGSTLVADWCARKQFCWHAAPLLIRRYLPSVYDRRGSRTLVRRQESSLI